MASVAVSSKRTFAMMSGHVVDSSHLPKKPEHTLKYPSRASLSSAGLTSRYGPDAADEESTADLLATFKQYGVSRSFNPDASLVLVGARGTGKSSLGVIAATAFHWRLIETHYAFQQMTGQSIAAYRKIYGTVEYNRKALEVLDFILENHASRCVIVCGLLSITEEAQERLLFYSQTHPIVHIIRDTDSVQKYLKMEKSRVIEMTNTTERIFRALCNFEFYNISDHAESSEERLESPTPPATPRSSTPYLTLKKAERYFLKFLAVAIDINHVSALDKAFPLSRAAIETRRFTYVMSTSVEKVTQPTADVERLEEGADAFELRVAVDSSSSFTHLSKSFSVLRRSTIIPVIYHVETSNTTSRAAEATSWSPRDRLRYLDLIYHGLKMAPEYLTLDLSLTDEDLKIIMRAKGKAKVIAHCYSESPQLLSWDHPHWQLMYQRAQSIGFHFVRLCWPATTINDNFALERFRATASALKGPKIPLIAFNTGPLGRTSCCFNPILQPVTHGGSEKGTHDLTRPCLTATEATKALFSSFVFQPLTFYIMGASSSYSLSPAMHNAAYRVCGMPHAYKTFQTPHLNDLHKLVNDESLGGCSISLPFKLDIMTLATSVSSHAKAIGAINTLIAIRQLDENNSVPDDIAILRDRNRSGPIKALYGENTDWIGIRACVRRGLSPANAVSPKTTMLVVGAGGMSRAAIYAMLQLGVRNIVIYNRTRANAEKLNAHFRQLLDDKKDGRSSPLTIDLSSDTPVQLIAIDSADEPWPEGLRLPTIIVSCIPTHRIGESPSPNFTLPEHWLQSPTGGVVMEVAYRNIRSPLLEQIRHKASAGWITMDGLDLLPEQAFAQFELFTGRRAPRRLMRAEVLKGYRDEEGRPDPEIIEQRLACINDQDP